MRIRNIILTSLIAGSQFAVTSCKKAPLRPMAENAIQPVVTQKIDSIAKETQKILQNSKYQKFGEDTLKLTKDFFSNPKKFVDNMNKFAAVHSPEECVGAYTEMIQIHNGNSITTIPKLRQIYEDVYKNAKAVISSTKIFTRNNRDMYVPVEYYGIPKKK